MKTLRRILRGIPGHVGTPYLLFISALGWLAAEHWYGAAVMLGIYGPLYLVGAHWRGKDMERET